MKRCWFRFYAELNDFLPPERRQAYFSVPFPGRPAVKDLIESLGVPHTEVDLVLVNGEAVDFSYQLEDGDRVSVYPPFETLDITPLLKVRPEPMRNIRFVLDVHLGKLAAYLRMIGFDALYNNNYSDEILARISVEQRRVLLTRDRGLLKRGDVTHGYCIRASDPPSQVVEVLRRFDLFNAIRPFTRCMHCNSTLEGVPKEEVQGRLPAKVCQNFEQFHRCRGCGQVYWKGTHYERMEKFINQVRSMSK